MEKGIVYLINQGMKNGPNGSCSQGGHSTAWHGIATYALAESYTFCKDLKYNIPKLEVTKKVNERILNGQTTAGGYVYQLPRVAAVTTPWVIGDAGAQSLQARKIIPDAKFEHIDRS